MKKKDRTNQSKEGGEEPSFDFVFKNFTISHLSTTFILNHWAEPIPTEERGAFEIQTQKISLREHFYGVLILLLPWRCQYRWSKIN